MNFNEKIDKLEKKLFEYKNLEKSMVAQYFLEYVKWARIYGEKMCILQSCGSFYENYSFYEKIENKEGIEEKITYGNTEEIASILNMAVARQNGTYEVNLTNCLMAGFPLYVLDKHLTVLLNEGFTVIIYEQIKKKDGYERKLKGIYSPTTNLSDDKLINNNRNNYLMTLVIDGDLTNFISGVCFVDLSTGIVYVSETFSTQKDNKKNWDDLYRLTKSFQPIEINIKTNNNKIINDLQKIKEKVIEKLELNDDINIYIKELIQKHQKIEYQNEILSKVYSSNRIISVIEYLELTRYQLATLALVECIEFVNEHSSTILKKLKKPEILLNKSNLILENNAITQLNLLDKDKLSLYKILNKCGTSMGSRLLRERLTLPETQSEKIEEKYEIIGEIIKEEVTDELLKYLRKIPDLERYFRRMQTGMMKLNDFIRLDNGYTQTIIFMELLIKKVPKIAEKFGINNEFLGEIEKFRKTYNKYLNVKDMDKYSQENIGELEIGTFIKKGISENLDKLIEENNTYREYFREILQIINKILSKSGIKNGGRGIVEIKMCNNERDGYFMSISKTKKDFLVKNLGEYANRFGENKDKEGENKESEKFEYKTLTSAIKITNKKMENLSTKAQINKKKIAELTLTKYRKLLEILAEKFEGTLVKTQKIVSEIDFCVNGAKLSTTNRYFRPKIVEKDQSYVSASNLRNPLAEQLVNTIYVPNDINLEKGIILFGINSVGKSTLLKGIALNIVMAQIGYYVAAESFQYSPFLSIFCRISNVDNIYGGLSSFAVEMTELKSILARSNNKTLVLCDELCCSTENESAISIGCASILRFIEKECCFIFATHLHSLFDIDELKNNEKIQFKHLAVEIQEGKLIFERKLRDGGINRLYGLEVSRGIIDDLDFNKSAEKIRKKLLKEDTHEIISSRGSHFNSNLFIDKCQICGSKEKLETHHINEQHLANKCGFIEHFHKNNYGNLVCLCWNCHHKKVHAGLIEIKGWQDTTKGRELNIIYKK